MTKVEIRKEIKKVFPEAKIKFIYDIAHVMNWRELDGGKYSRRYTGKHDFYEVLRNNNLIAFVTIGS